jgi:sodium-independent sulfate anion transporter 11
VYKQDDEVPLLRAIVIDCSTIHNIDITSVQGLVDVRNALDRWASPSTIEWHFGGLHNRWARRALAVAGFGRSAAEDYHTIGSWAPVLPLASEEADGESRKQKTCADDESSIGLQNSNVRSSAPEEIPKAGDQVARRESGTGKQTHQPVFAIDRPFFHADLGEAVSAALAHASRSDCRLHTDTDTETD